jgi:hypothetical protein
MAATAPGPIVDDLIQMTADTDRGASTSPQQRDRIMKAVDALKQIQAGRPTTGSDLDATWKLLWSSEKETQFIVKNAKLFGTQAGDIYQVIDTQRRKLQNVITFPPSGMFLVESSIDPEPGSQRTNFQFIGASLTVNLRKFKVPPFGKGWFDSVYMDERIRCARDIRDDTLVAVRDGNPRLFS